VNARRAVPPDDEGLEFVDKHYFGVADVSDLALPLESAFRPQNVAVLDPWHAPQMPLK
jgi:hypothetical protein